MSSIVISFALVLLTVYLTFQYWYSYWKKRHIAYVKPLPVIGNLWQLLLLKVSFGELFQNLYEHPDLKNSDYGGIFILHQPALILRDPALIQKVLIKDFNMFANRYEAADPKHDSMGSLCLPLAKYPIWRNCRLKMAEIFTTGRIKERMYPLMLLVARDMNDFILNKFENNKVYIDLDVKEMCSLYTTDLTSTLHYGFKADGLKKGRSVLRQQTKELFKTNFKKIIDFFIIFFLPHFATNLRAKVFSPAYSKFMRQFCRDILEQRRNSPLDLTNKGDLLDVLEKFQKLETDTHNFTHHPDFIPSQLAIFLLAGFETSSSVISFILYELTKNEDIQQRLRLELKQSFQQEAFLSYEKLQALNYLHQVVCEGLRLYPAAAFVNRECTPNDKFTKGYYLKPDLFIPRGMPVYISILGLHRDPRVSCNEHCANIVLF